MGNKNVKKNDRKASIASSLGEIDQFPFIKIIIEANRPRLNKVKDLSDTDYELLMTQTGMSKEEIIHIFERFESNNPGSLLNKKEFTKFHVLLVPETKKFLNDMVDFISKYEFIVSYSLSSKDNLKKKLEYEFALYDSDNGAYIDKVQMTDLINSIVDLASIDRKSSINLSSDEADNKKTVGQEKNNDRSNSIFK